MDKDNAMRNLYPNDTDFPLTLEHHQNWPSSSSSSFKSLSTGGSPEYSSLLMSNMLSTSTPGLEQAIRPTSTSITIDRQTMQAYNNCLGIDSVNPESDEAVMTRAMLAVLSSRPQQTQTGSRESAFKKYTSAPLAPHSVHTKVSRLGQHMLKRSILILRNMYMTRFEEQAQAIRPTTSSQLHHKMSERKRREKLNQTFQQLRSLLPPGTKKDKASVLSSTRDYMCSLKAEVLELKQKNQVLEARELSNRSETVLEATSTSNERIHVKIIQSSESTSEERVIDLQLTVRGECCIKDLVIRVLEFLKQVKNVRLLYIEADTKSQQAHQLYRLSLRMKIEEGEGEWDETAFQEAMESVVAEVAL